MSARRPDPPEEGLSPWYWGALGVGALALGVGIWARARGAASPGSSVHFLRLASAPFPQQDGPGAAVVIPAAYSRWRPLKVCVYFRGFTNCVATIIGPADAKCHVGGDTHHASHLAQQLEESGSNTVLIVPELLREQASDDPGQMGRAGALPALLAEVFSMLEPQLGSQSLSDVAHLGVMAHSGGYRAMASVLRDQGGAIRSVALLDSLYGYDNDFARWVLDRPQEFTPSGSRRFADIYTSGAGTAERSAGLADRIIPALRSSGMNSGILDARDGNPLPQSAFAANPVLFDFTRLSHTDVSRVFPKMLWAGGW